MIEIKDLKFPLNRRYYTKNGSHIWFIEDKGNIKIGMDSFLTENAGYLSYLTIDEKEFNQGDSIGSFESAKFVSRFYSPITGRIVNINEDVVNDPIKINRDPYNSWIVEIEPKDVEKDLQSNDILEGEERIRQWIEDEINRLDEDVCK